MPDLDSALSVQRNRQLDEALLLRQPGRFENAVGKGQSIGEDRSSSFDSTSLGTQLVWPRCATAGPQRYGVACRAGRPLRNRQ